MSETLERIVKCVVIFILAAIAIAGFCLLFAGPVWLLWNWVGVGVLGLKVITFWEALGLMLLSGLLFGSINRVSYVSRGKDQ